MTGNDRKVRAKAERGARTGVVTAAVGSCMTEAGSATDEVDECITMPLITNPWIKDRVERINHQIDHDIHKGKQQNECLDNRVVTGQHGFDH